MFKLKTVIFISLTMLILGTFIGAVATLFYQSSVQVGNIGTIRTIGVEVYQSENLTDKVEFIDWGMIGVGSSKDFTVWIKNTGNDDQRIIMWTESWNPTNSSDFIFLTWGYDNSWIPINASIPAVFTLSVDLNIVNITNFSFDIWIKGVH